LGTTLTELRTRIHGLKVEWSPFLSINLGALGDLFAFISLVAAPSEGLFIAKSLPISIWIPTGYDIYLMLEGCV
jgi:hypothetical protein